MLENVKLEEKNIIENAETLAAVYIYIYISCIVI